MRDRSKVTLGGFKGLDTLSTPINVSANHATEMENLIYRDGTNHKRYGWKTRHRLRVGGKFLSIKGIFNFKLLTEEGYKDYLIVYADKKFYKLEGGAFIQLYTNNALLDQECKCFVNNNKAYFIGCGDYLVFSAGVMQRVVDSEVYIPTTTENIGFEEDGTHYQRVTAEERNLLTPYIKNTLFGRKEVDEVATYYLDKVNATDIEVSIERMNGEEREIVVLESTANIPLYANDEIIGKGKIVLNGFACKYSGLKISFEPLYKILGEANKSRVFVALRTKTYETKGIYEVPKLVEVNILVSKEGDTKNTTLTTYETNVSVDDNNFCTLESNEVTLDLLEYGVKYEPTNCVVYKVGEVELSSANEDCKGSFDYENCKLTLNKVEGNANFYEPITPDVPNITVKLKLEEKSNIVTLSNIANVFGLSGVHDRLFLVDNTGNTIRWTKDDDFTYFGEKSYCLCGGTETKIIGLERQSDSTLLAVKEHSVRDASIFTISGRIDERTIDGRVDYTTIFSAKGYQVGMSAIGEIINFNGECLMVCRDGVYAVKLGENSTIETRYVVPRSKQISNKLEKKNLSQAKCVSFNNKLYLAIDGECYVADSSQITNVGTDMNSTANYEWWKWTNMPVKVWGYVNNELWFGTDDGQLCSFTNDYFDEEITELSAGLIAYDTNDDGTIDETEFGRFAISNSFKIDNDDKFIIECDFYGKIECPYEVVDGETRYYVPLNHYKDGEEIIVGEDKVVITKTDEYISINQKATDGVFYKNFKGIELGVKVGQDNFELLYNGKEITWKGTDHNPSINDFIGTLYHKQPIKAYWISGAMDLGTTTYSKTLTYLIIAGEKNLANHLKYAIRTRVDIKEFELLRDNNGFDWLGFDLKTLSLDSDYASTYSRKLNIRNVNYITFYYESDLAEDIAINSVQIEFKINKKNIGAR